MAKNQHTSLPLYQRIAHKNTLQRAMDLIIFFLYLSILTLRLTSISRHGIPWIIAFLCESWFAFMWVLTINTKWNPVEYKTYPEHLVQRVCELPAVDMFVTTADPNLEPPILTVNTVLSLMAVDYPAHKLACYVSDDGASALTFFSLLEASKFAKLWVPFCKKYGVSLRAPFRHFTIEGGHKAVENSLEFEHEHQQMKDEYEKLVNKIQDATHKPSLYDLNSKEFQVFSNIERSDHASIIKVIWENKGNLSDGLPHLVYISREKHPKNPHRYKAGAMNVLTRVSGVMTNAPFMLNVDCDMYANNPQIVMHAMCLMLGLNEIDSGFVQFPQDFYSGPREAFRVFNQYVGRGMVGLQVPIYQGTGCFHRRKVIYGSRPEDKETKKRNSSSVNEKHVVENMQKRFGNSVELARSAAEILSGSMSSSTCQSNLLSLVDAAVRVAGCGYEFGTSWGERSGWMYGSTVEDLLTGMMIHSRGWKSVSFAPDPPAFLGCAPMDGATAMTQQKRWSTGLLENLFGRHNPLSSFVSGRLSFRGCLAYMWFLSHGPRCIVDLCYAALPAYCIMANSYFLPKGLALGIHFTFLMVSSLYSLSEFLRVGALPRAWWNSQKMFMVNSATARLFGLFSIIMKHLGLSEPVFMVTQKGQATSSLSDCSFTFNESWLYVPATTISLVHITALAVALLGFGLPSRGGPKSGSGFGLGEIGCCVWVVVCFWPFIEGLFKRGRYGIPSSTICKSVAFALLFVHFCRQTTVV